MITTAKQRRGRLRTFAAVTTSGLVLVAMAGCSSGSASDSSSSSAAAVESAPASAAASSAEATAESEAAVDTNGMTIQFVNPLPSFPTWKLIGECMKKEADKFGAILSESGPTGQADNPAVMIQQMQQAIANQVDALVTFPASEGFSEVLKQAQAAGIVTGTYYGPGGPESGASFNIGPDWTYIGETVVNAVAALPGEHVLGLVAAADTGLGKSWLDGIRAAAAKTDNVTIAGEVYTADDAAKALPQVTALLTAHPEVTQIVTHMGTVTPGAVAAIKAQGLEGKTFLLAVGQDNGGAQAAEEGTANLVLMQDVCTLGIEMVDGVVDVFTGQTPPIVPIPIAVIPAAQVQEYMDKGYV